MHRELRRKERSMSEADIQRVLGENGHGVLATVGEDGAPYAVPVSYVWHQGAIWFHSASQGHKVDNIARDSRVCFTVIGEVDMHCPKPQAYFESVILFGRCQTVTDFEQRVAGMEALMRIFMPDKVHETREDMQNMARAIHVYRIEPEHISGKIRRRAEG